MTETEVCLELFLDWLNRIHARAFRTDEFAHPGLAVDGPLRIAVEVHPLVGPTENQPWLALRDQLQQEIARDLPGAYALWLPAGADLPSGAEEAAGFVRRVREAAAGLQPGDRSYVPLPITLYLRRTQQEGTLVSVSGGLNPHWARLSERVQGAFDLDSTRLHRLPESDEHLERLMETVWERARQLDSPGQWVEIETIDAWTVQRLAAGEGLAIVGVPPEETQDMGLAVRRNFRRLLAAAGRRLRQREADLRALVALGYYPRLEQEGATTALRGYDPALYADIDFICLAADGLIKPLIQLPAHLLPWS
ncbi:MAG TPA: hypothetical protein VFT91_07385 [Dehalococcoidia bacterium]|nr:hypothetical protein [Dehalococcoidia bacterium]